MSSTKPIYQQNLAGANSFYSVALSEIQLCCLAKVRIAIGGAGVQVYCLDTEELVVEVAEDTVRSGRGAIIMALSTFLSTASGASIISPVNYRVRARAFSVADGPDYSDYVRAMSGSGISLTNREVTKSEDGELSLQERDLQPDSLYVMHDSTEAFDVIDVVAMVHASGLACKVRIARPAARVLNRIITNIPSDVPVLKGEDGRYVTFGKDSGDIAPFVPGPECASHVNEIVELLRHLPLDADALRDAIDSIVEGGPDVPPRQEASARAMPVGHVAAPVALRELGNLEADLVSSLIRYGEAVRSRSEYTRVDQAALFGNRQKSNGTSLIKCLATQIAAWRASVVLSSHAVEDTVREIANILLQDQSVNQGGSSISNPVLAAIVVLCRSSNVYKLHLGAELGDDGKHYPRAN